MVGIYVMAFESQYIVLADRCVVEAVVRSQITSAPHQRDVRFS